MFGHHLGHMVAPLAQLVYIPLMDKLHAANRIYLWTLCTTAW